MLRVRAAVGAKLGQIWVSFVKNSVKLRVNVRERLRLGFGFWEVWAYSVVLRALLSGSCAIVLTPDACASGVAQRRRVRFRANQD